MDAETKLYKETLTELFQKATESKSIGELRGSVIFNTAASHLHAVGAITDDEYLQSQGEEVE